MTDYANFRSRLDAVLRTFDVEQVQDLLIAEEQWHEGQPADPEFAMWMMAIKCYPFYTFSLTMHLSR